VPLSPAYENYLLVRAFELGSATRFIGCAPGLSGGIGGIPLTGGTGGRTPERFGMASKMRHSVGELKRGQLGRTYGLNTY
jgi:hypothetical protein